jgi:hypothetical protein
MFSQEVRLMMPRSGIRRGPHSATAEASLHASQGDRDKAGAGNQKGLPDDRVARILLSVRASFGNRLRSSRSVAMHSSTRSTRSRSKGSTSSLSTSELLKWQNAGAFVDC